MACEKAFLPIKMQKKEKNLFFCNNIPIFAAIINSNIDRYGYFD